MLDPLQIPQAYITSELDFHRDRFIEEHASAEMSRRAKIARRQKRQQTHRRQSLRRNSPRTV